MSHPHSPSPRSPISLLKLKTKIPARLSVVIPHRNQPELFASMLHSLTQQSIASQLELIVIDDASPPDQVQILQEQLKLAPIQNCKLLHYDQQSGTMSARLAGFTQAQAPFVYFCDADDILIGTTGLEEILHCAESTNADIAHFRAAGIRQNGECLGELLWAAPFIGELIDTTIFSYFFGERSYPPLVIWNKIFNRTFFSHVADIARKHTIFRFEDKFLVSLAITLAKKYHGVNVLAYQYTMSEIWTIEKYAGRIADIFTIYTVITSLLQKKSFSLKNRHDFFQFAERRMAINMGKLCTLADLHISKNGDVEDIFRITMHYMNKNKLLKSLEVSSKYNATKIDAIRNGSSYAQ